MRRTCGSSASGTMTAKPAVGDNSSAYTSMSMSGRTITSSQRNRADDHRFTQRAPALRQAERHHDLVRGVVAGTSLRRAVEPVVGFHRHHPLDRVVVPTTVTVPATVSHHQHQQPLRNTDTLCTGLWRASRRASTRCSRYGATVTTIRPAACPAAFSVCACAAASSGNVFSTRMLSFPVLNSRAASAKAGPAFEPPLDTWAPY